MRAKSLKKFLRDIGVLNEYSRPHTPQDQAIIERLFRTTKQEEVYRQEYTDHLDARDSLSRFLTTTTIVGPIRASRMLPLTTN
jgi:transposase InsO family protein